ncbi:MAG: 3-oxoadipate enol-lactonase [Geminicoccaceae bacterium]
MAFANLNGFTTHFSFEASASESGGGMPMVFVNSLGTDFRVFDALLPHLAKGRAVLRHDKRGHGLSDVVDAPLTIDQLADDLAALMDHCGVSRALVVGLSIGGLIAQSLAANRPELVAGLVLMDTAHRIGTADMWNQRIGSVREGGLAAMADAILERWFTAEFRSSRPVELSGWRNMLSRTPAVGYTRCCEAIRDADYTASTSRLAVPALCIVGREDGSTPVEVVRELAGLIAEAEFEIIENAGHLPCVEQPERTAERIERFIADRLA